jgi:hypothetical protein
MGAGKMNNLERELADAIEERRALRSHTTKMAEAVAVRQAKLADLVARRDAADSRVKAIQARIGARKTSK